MSIIAEKLAELSREVAIEVLSKAGIACDRLSDINDLVAHPQRRLVKVATASGEVELLAPGARTDAISESFGPVPELGEHMEALRKEFDASGS